jgi:hypothetical protein
MKRARPTICDDDEYQRLSLLPAGEADLEAWLAVADEQARRKRRRQRERLDWPIDFLEDMLTHEIVPYLPFRTLFLLGQTCRAFSRIWKSWVHTIIIDNSGNVNVTATLNRVPRLTYKRLSFFPNVTVVYLLTPRSSPKRHPDYRITYTTVVKSCRKLKELVVRPFILYPSQLIDAERRHLTIRIF